MQVSNIVKICLQTYAYIKTHMIKRTHVYIYTYAYHMYIHIHDLVWSNMYCVKDMNRNVTQSNIYHHSKPRTTPPGCPLHRPQQCETWGTKVRTWTSLQQETHVLGLWCKSLVSSLDYKWMACWAQGSEGSNVFHPNEGDQNSGSLISITSKQLWTVK